ncbi:uncharacterized protein LOC128396264 [Panonychus citri]|uniref:uncharacterized protein LOC128396264 n=1 Tax=Panonychus citri TaxID=50023 RepID=UPI00230718DB|nr:uncharacterized protein LOC128396264 [Panonychus citri]
MSIPAPPNANSLGIGRIAFSLEVFQSNFKDEKHLNVSFENILSNLLIEIISPRAEFRCLSGTNSLYKWEKNGLVHLKTSTQSDEKTRSESYVGLWEVFIYMYQPKVLLENAINCLSRSTALIPLSTNVQPDGDVNLSDAHSRKIGFLWKLIKGNDKPFVNFDSFHSCSSKNSEQIIINGFSFGNIINGTKFVEHFKSLKWAIYYY